MQNLYIGLMSGTSIDAVDGVLVNFNYNKINKDTKKEPEELELQSFEVLARTQIEFSDAFRKTILELQTPAFNELHLSELAANQLVHEYYAPCVHDLLQQTSLKPENIQAIAAHGQTLRHQPKAHDGLGYSIQLNQPALLAALTDIPVIADFRVADIYRGGQGAPLVPAFHQQLHRLYAGQKQATSIFCNIGGMSNISIIQTIQTIQTKINNDNYNNNDNDNKNYPTIGFDCGPGNVLLDAWIQKNLGKTYDKSGAWAASGQCLPDLLQQFLQHPYFSQAFPKSTGREVFNLGFIEDVLLKAENQYLIKQIKAEDVQNTLTELTAIAIEQAITHAENLRTNTNNTNNNKGFEKNHHPNQLYICGGGAYNDFLIHRLQSHLPQYQIASSQAIGIDTQDMEALAFAWLGFMRWHQQSIAWPSITGAKAASIAGAIYL